MSATSPPRAERGFTYLALIFAVAILSAVLGATGHVWHKVQQREKELELLHLGKQFRHAIGLYYQRTQGPVKRYPRSLEELVEDKRFPTAQRYLRKIPRDPITGRAEWGLVKALDGGIAGVHSLSEQSVMKTGNFRPADLALTGKTTYNEWQFVYVAPVVQARPPGATPQPGTPAPITPASGTAVPSPPAPSGSNITGSAPMGVPVPLSPSAPTPMGTPPFPQAAPTQ